MSLNAIAVIAGILFVIAVPANNEPSVEDLVFYNGKIVDARYPVYGYEHRPDYPY
jgi:hypothetical protein